MKPMPRLGRAFACAVVSDQLFDGVEHYGKLLIVSLLHPFDLAGQLAILVPDTQCVSGSLPFKIS